MSRVSRFHKEFWGVRPWKAIEGREGLRILGARCRFDILRGIRGVLGKLCASWYEVALFSSSFLMAFFGAFRVGELISPSKIGAGGHEGGGGGCGHKGGDPVLEEILKKKNN